MTKRAKIVVAVVAVVAAFALLISAGAVYLLFRDKTEAYTDNENYRYAFGYLRYETLNYTADDADRETAQPIWGLWRARSLTMAIKRIFRMILRF